MTAMTALPLAGRDRRRCDGLVLPFALLAGGLT